MVNSRKMAKTVLYNEMLREGSREEWKWKGERNVCCCNRTVRVSDIWAAEYYPQRFRSYVYSYRVKTQVFFLCCSRKVAKTELYNERKREGRREEGKVREKEVNGKVRERKKRQLMGRGLSVRILVRRECKCLALRNSQKMAETQLYCER